MRGKYTEQKRAIEMRISGETIPKIAEKLNVSKASVSLWMRRVKLPQKTLEILKTRKEHNRVLAHEARREATRKKLFRANADSQVLLSQRYVDPETALILCSLMYWCEGAKSKNDAEFTFTNAEPLTIKGFLTLLRNALPLDESRFRVKMHLHEYHNERVQKKFWSEVTNIPETQFQKTFWKPHTGKNVKQNYPGCIHVRYHDVTVSRKILATARHFLAHPNVVK